MNKKILATIVLMAAFCGKASAEAVGDTLVIEDVNKVRIETRDTVQRIVISGSKDDPQLHYVQRISIPDSSAVRRKLTSVKDFNKIVITRKDGKPSKWESSLHLHIGVGTMLDAPKEYDFKAWPSFHGGLAWLADWRPYGRQNVWSVGLGLEYKHYSLGDDAYLTKTGDMLTPVPFGSNQKETSASIGVGSLGLPVLYTHYFDKRQRWGLTLGGIVNWNFSATASQHYEVGDDSHDVNTRKIGQKPFTVDALVIAHIPSFPDVYCKYSPMKFFKDGRGPKVNQISFGICF